MDGKTSHQSEDQQHPVKDTKYIGPVDIHDGAIVDMQCLDDSLEVQIRSCEGRLFRVVFDRVAEIEDNRAVGMMLYALIERESEGSRRTFVFANWDDDDDASLQVVAETVRFPTAG